jgi:hypothetical protein
MAGLLTLIQEECLLARTVLQDMSFPGPLPYALSCCDWNPSILRCDDTGSKIVGFHCSAYLGCLIQGPLTQGLFFLSREQLYLKVMTEP